MVTTARSAHTVLSLDDGSVPMTHGIVLMSEVACTLDNDGVEGHMACTQPCGTPCKASGR